MDPSEDEIEEDRLYEQTDTPDINTPSKRYNLFLLNNGWNDKNEHLIVCISHNCVIYKEIHEQLKQFFKFIYYILSLTIVALNATILVQTIVFLEDKFLLTQKILIYTVTILSVIVNFLNIQERSTQHDNYSKQFSELSHEIQNQISTYRQDRSYAPKYVYRIQKRYDHLSISGPDIPSFILKRRKYRFINIGELTPVNTHNAQNTQNTHNTQNTQNTHNAQNEQNTHNAQNEQNEQNTLNLLNLNIQQNEKDMLNPNTRININVIDTNSLNKLDRYTISNSRIAESDYKIKGDLSEEDIDSIPDLQYFDQLRQLKNKAIRAQTQYEMQRMGLGKPHKK